MRATRSGAGTVVPMNSDHSSSAPWTGASHFTVAGDGFSSGGLVAPPHPTAMKIHRRKPLTRNSEFWDIFGEVQAGIAESPGSHPNKYPT